MNEDDIARFNPDAYALAQLRVKHAPLHLTESDFDQLSIISESLETAAREAQKQAQLALVATHTAAPVLTKSVEPKAARVLTMCKVSQETVADEIIKTIKAALEKNNEAWETKYRALETRLLEIEAAHAVTR